MLATISTNYFARCYSIYCDFNSVRLVHIVILPLCLAEQKIWFVFSTFRKIGFGVVTNQIEKYESNIIDCCFCTRKWMLTNIYSQIISNVLYLINMGLMGCFYVYRYSLIIFDAQCCGSLFCLPIFFTQLNTVLEVCANFNSLKPVFSNTGCVLLAAKTTR